MDWSLTRIQTALDFAAEGRQSGDLMLRHSDDANPLGYYPIPAAVLKNGAGPTLLLVGGTHGDEYEGPAALLRLLHDVDLSTLRGRLILLPALNAPAVYAAGRCSPLDGGNLNRAFPGDRDGGPTAAIAHLLEQVILPHCDAAIDLHAGGRASVFAPLTMCSPSPRRELFAANLALAEAFGCPLLWVMGDANDDRSLNAAAQRQRVPMFATELGGAGRADPALVELAVDGIYRVMAYLGMLAAAPRQQAPPPRYVQVRSLAATRFAPRDGVFVAAVEPAQRIEAGRPAGVIYSLDDIQRPPAPLTLPAGDVVLSVGNRGLVRRGDFLLQTAYFCERPDAAQPAGRSHS